MKFNYTAEGQRDFLAFFNPWFEKHMMKLTEDGNFKVNMKNPCKTPWRFIRSDLKRNCKILLELIFPAFNFVPSRCQECWKLVVRPKTLKELFQLVDIQETCDYFCKCGIEERPIVYGNYGGYFYFNSVEEGLDGLDEIRKRVKDEISPDIPVILKRGCTEMEQAFRNSSKWEVTESQKKIEAEILPRISMGMKVTEQSPEQIRRVFRRWVEFAYSIGDTTYMEFNNGEPLYQPPDTYERGK